MNAIRGRVRGGHVETEAALPEGAEVIVLTGSDQEAFDLDEVALDELETRIAAADGGDVEPAASVLDRLRTR